MERDGLGRVVEERVYDAGTTLRMRTEHHYDAAGRLEWDQQNGDLATKVTYEYDAFDRQTAKVDPDSGRWERRYDKAGNLQCVDDPIGDQHVWIVYDGVNRVVRREHRHGACPPSQSVSDPNEIVACTEFGYYAGDAGVTLAGRPAFERTCDGTCDACVAEGREMSSRTFTRYHPRGMVEEVRQSIHPPGQIERHYVTTRTYDAAGRLKTTTVPYDETTDETVTYQYSAEAALVAVYSDKHQYVNDIAYDYLGRVTSMAYANGVTDTRQYWPVDTSQPGRGLRLSELTTTGPAGTLQHTVHLTYRATGQPQDAWDLVHTGQSDPLNNSWTAQYDDLGRLVSWVRAGGSPVQSTFTYDDLGNLTSKDGKTYFYDLDGPHQASQVGTEFLDYDAAGHMVQLPGNEGAEWDAEGRLTRVCTGRCDNGGTTRATYGYDANGDRIWADAPQGGFTYYFDGFDVSGGAVPVSLDTGQEGAERCQR